MTEILIPLLFVFIVLVATSALGARLQGDSVERLLREIADELKRKDRE